jgi:hypothetical protein
MVNQDQPMLGVECHVVPAIPTQSIGGVVLVPDLLLLGDVRPVLIRQDLDGIRAEESREIIHGVMRELEVGARIRLPERLLSPRLSGD